MKIVTDDKVSELTVMLLKNDKKIKDELIQSVDDRFEEVNTKIEEINKESMPTIPIEEINNLFT